MLVAWLISTVIGTAFGVFALWCWNDRCRLQRELNAAQTYTVGSPQPGDTIEIRWGNDIAPPRKPRRKR